MEEQRKQANRYAHLVTSSAANGNQSGSVKVSNMLEQQAGTKSEPRDLASMRQKSNVNQSADAKPGAQSRQAYANSNYNSFSNLDWREQWIMFKERVLEKASEPGNQRKLILFIVCCALLLDNMLYMVIVPIIPDYLRSIGAWSTYTENAKWIRRNATVPSSASLSRHRTHLAGAASSLQAERDNKWERVGGQVVYEGEDSAVGFLFASKAIVQLFINPFSGAIIDRIGYELPMMIGLTVMFFSTMVFACGQTYSVLFLARSLQGVGSAFADTAGLAMIADRFTEENERQRALGVALAFISFGCLVAPPFGAVLYQAAGKEVPFIILSLVCLLDGSLLLLVTPPGTFGQLLPGYRAPPEAFTYQQSSSKPAIAATGSSSEPSPSSLSSALDEEPETGEQHKQRRAAALRRQKSISRRHSMTVASDGEAPRGTPIYVLFRDPYIACCAGALVVANVSLAFLEPTISIWMQNTMSDIEEWQMGMIWLPAFVPHVLGVYSTVRLADKYPRYQWLIAAIGLVLEGVSCLMVPFCSSFWSLIIPISLICFGLALIDTAILPTLGFLVDTRYVSVYGSIYAIADISYSLSYAIGPVIAGGIVEAIGFTALNFLIAIVTLGYTPVLAMLRSIRDYQPFAADLDQQHSKGALGGKSPFGKFGREPVEADNEETAQVATTTTVTNSSTKYESPRWASQAPGKSALAKKNPMQSPAWSEPAEPHKRQTVKIVEGQSSSPAAGNQETVERTNRNPFLADTETG